MNWLFIALLNPVFHAFNNHIDKYILNRYMKGGSVGAIILFMALFSIVALPVIYALHPTIFNNINWLNTIILIANGCLLVLAILFYFYALNDDEASFVAPFFQLIPVIGFILSYLILGEVLQGKQIWAAAIIVAGSFILSLDLSKRKTKFRQRMILLMLASSFFYAINAVIFKAVAIHQGFLDSLFWDMSGKFLFGVVLFLSIKPYREQFLHVIKVNKFFVIELSMFNELISLIAEAALVLAVLFAPVALVQSVAGLQSVFLLIIGIFLTIFLPKLAKESLTPKVLWQKIISIVIITIGVILISVA